MLAGAACGYIRVFLSILPADSPFSDVAWVLQTLFLVVSQYLSQICPRSLPPPSMMPPKKEEHADTALRVVQAFLKNPAINHFTLLDQENAKLREDNNRRAVFQEQQEQRLVELLEQKKQEKTRADSLDLRLATQQKANKDLADGNAATRRQLRASQDVHEDVSKKLGRLESFSVKMLPTSAFVPLFPSA